MNTPFPFQPRLAGWTVRKAFWGTLGAVKFAHMELVGKAGLFRIDRLVG